jgi:3-oxoacyl-[acyl-carrier-protein] synthase-1
MPGTSIPTIAPLAVRAFTATTAAGAGVAALAEAVRSTGMPGSVLRANRAAPAAGGTPLPAFVARIDALDDAPLPAALAAWDCRATRLAWAGLHADDFAAGVRSAVQRWGASRVGLVLGTSASTIAASEQAYREPASDGGFPAALQLRALHSPHALTDFSARVLGLAGPALTVSTACSSSARAFGVAERWLRLGLVDAVVVGGVDALCDSVLYGFQALGLVSPEPCRPFDARRRGISVGEAAGFALLERRAAGVPPASGALQLLGYGEANDAHHMSSPHPDGLGAEQSLDEALARSGLVAADIDYLNLHGTGTPQNDAVEAALVARRYAAGVHASATKGLTGHAMGAAGIVEAVLCLLALGSGWRSGSAGLDAPDPSFGPRFAAQLHRLPHQAAARTAASHSFGFGGNNAVLIFGRD